MISIFENIPTGEGGGGGGDNPTFSELTSPRIPYVGSDAHLTDTALLQYIDVAPSTDDTIGGWTNGGQIFVPDGSAINIPTFYDFTPGIRFADDGYTNGDGFMWYGHNPSGPTAGQAASVNVVMNKQLVMSFQHFRDGSAGGEGSKGIVVMAPFRRDTQATINGQLITLGISSVPWPEVYGTKYLFGNGTSQGENVYLGMNGNASLGLSFNTTTGADAVFNLNGSGVQKVYWRGSSTSILNFIYDESSNNSTASRDLILQAQNKTAGTGNGGNLTLLGGTSAGGQFGGVLNYADGDSTLRGLNTENYSNTLTDYSTPSAVKGGRLAIKRARGTKASPSAVTGFPSGNNTTALGSLEFYGWDGSDWGLGASIWSSVRSNFSGSSHLTDVHFSAVTSGVTLADYMLYNAAAGQVQFPLGMYTLNNTGIKATSFRPTSNDRRIVWSIYSSDSESSPVFGIGANTNSSNLNEVYFNLADGAGHNTDTIKFVHSSNVLTVSGRDDATNDANAAGSVTSRAGNKTAGTGNGGDYRVSGGTTTGGTAGSFYIATGGNDRLQVNASGVLKNLVAANESTGAGSAALGTNSPAVTNTAPYTWLKVLTSDGSTGYIPIWK